MITIARSCFSLLILLFLGALRAQAQTYALSTVAGALGEYGSTDTPLVAARFNARDIAIDPAGNLYVAEAENHTIRKITPAGVVSTFAGLAGVIGTADGIGSAARFQYPSGIAVDAAGNVHVADTYNHTIRKITPAGAVSTLAGSPQSGSADGAGSSAQFYFPAALALDRAGNLFVANSGSTIRKVTPQGVVSTFIQLLPDPAAAPYSYVNIGRLATDGADNLYVTDISSGTVLKVTPAGTTTILAGTTGQPGSIDGVGAAAAFYSPFGIVSDRAGNLFVLDRGNNTLRRIAPDGMVTTLAGQINFPGVVDDIGGRARLAGAWGMTMDAAGNLFFIDGYGAVIRKASPLNAPAPPILHLPPGRNFSTDSRYVGAGTTVAFNSAATGALPIAFQWHRNGNAIAGATSPTFTLASASTTDAGSYTVTVANSAGSFTSAPVTLSVYAPSLSSFATRRSVAGGSFLWAIASGPGQLVAVGTGGTILSSADGRTWMPRTSGTSEWLVGVTFGAGKFVAVGDRGTILVSSDGATWTRAISSGTTERINNVVFGNGRFVAVGEHGLALTSLDAQTWTPRSTGVDTWLRGLVYKPAVPMLPYAFGSNGSGLFYASGQGGRLLTSPDGELWFASSSPTNGKDIEAIAEGPVGIGQDGAVFSQFLFQLTSKTPIAVVDGRPVNGVSMYPSYLTHRVGLSARFRGLALGAGALFATGENGVIAAAAHPAGPWAILPSNTTANLVNGVFHGNSLFIVGENETILQSDTLYTSRLVNIATRANVTPATPMISGFVVRGDAPKQILLRAAGPALATFGVSGTLAAPTLTLFDGAQRPLATNAGWSTRTDAAAIAETAARVGAFPFAPGSRDAAILVTLPPGAYTAQVTTGAGSGVALVEAYDAETLASDGSRAINISTRGHVGTDANQLIAGFVISGFASRRVLIRAVGPTLGAFGVPDTLAEPRFQLIAQSGGIHWTIGAWSTNPTADELSGIAQTAGAFALAEGSKDAALVTTLLPGAYTVVVSGANNTTGTALVEVYDLP